MIPISFSWYRSFSTRSYAMLYRPHYQTSLPELQASVQQWRDTANYHSFAELAASHHSEVSFAPQYIVPLHSRIGVRTPLTDCCCRCRVTTSCVRVHTSQGLKTKVLGEQHPWQLSLLFHFSRQVATTRDTSPRVPAVYPPSHNKGAYMCDKFRKGWCWKTPLLVC